MAVTIAITVQLDLTQTFLTPTLGRPKRLAKKWTLVGEPICLQPVLLCWICLEGKVINGSDKNSVD